MPRKRPPFVRHEQNRHGDWRWYFRRYRNGPRVRLPDLFGTDDWWDAYNAALAGKAVKEPAEKTSPQTLAWLVEKYKESGHFASLRESTRRMRDNILKRLVEKRGDRKFSTVTSATIQHAMDDRAATPNAANNFLKVVRRMFKWAVASGYVSKNPCDGIEGFRVKSDGFHTWTMEEVEKYQAAHPVGTRARLALDLMLFTGLRRSDIVRVGRQHTKGGVISIKTLKTGVTVHVTVFKTLQTSIDAAPTGDMTYMVTERGLPFTSAASFGNWFADCCNEAKVPKNCRAHGLRKAGATIAADEGATSQQLIAMFGWTRTAQADVYTREADKRRLARETAARIENRLAPHVASGAAQEYNKTNENK